MTSARARAQSTRSRAARAWNTASATTSSVAKCAAALRSAASRSAAPETYGAPIADASPSERWPPSGDDRAASSSAASPSTLRNATAACGSTSLPSSTSASHSLETLSPGSELAPSLASHPAHSRLGRTDAAAHVFARCGSFWVTNSSKARHSVSRPVWHGKNAQGATSSAKHVNIQKHFSSSSVTSSSTPATVHAAALCPCGERAACATQTRSSASSKQ